jgi:hypothetical protein
MSASGQDEPRKQIFYGSGSFGGNNHGIINNVLLDPKTEALVAEMAKYAPPLTGLLEKAIRDGVMSPDAVEALMLAARNINEEVAWNLRIAGQNINEEVAWNLRSAGDNINGKVADRFVYVKDELNETAGQLDSLLSSLRQTVGQLSSLQKSSNLGLPLEPVSTARAVSLPIQKGRDKWSFRIRLACCGFGTGLLVAMILTYSHLGIYATLAGAFILALAALIHFAETRL